VSGTQKDIIGVVNDVDPTIERLITGAAQIAVAFVALAVFVPAFTLRRYRLLGYILIGNLLTGLAFNVIVAWIGHGNLERVARETTKVSITIGVLDPRGLGNIAASFIILAPFVSVRWRRIGMILTVAFTLARFMGATRVPDDVFLALAVGATCGCLTLLAFGRPERRPTLSAIRTALRTSGLPDAEVVAAPTEDRTVPEYVAALHDGSTVTVRVVNPADRSADLLYRTYRLIRWKDVGDERPFASLRRGVEHEALVSFQARDVGVSTPRLRAVAAVGNESMLLAYDAVPKATPLTEIDPARLHDDVLRDLWEQVAVLRRHRIGHRALQRANILIDADGRPWLRGFAYSEIAAPDTVLDADIAQLLTVVGLEVGVQRSVDAAVATLGRETVARSLPLLQAAAMRSATRQALKDHHELLAELRDAVAKICAVEAPHEVQLERVSRRTIVMFASLALATYFLLPQFADLNKIIEQVGEANWWWFPLVLVASGATYVGATIAISGAVPRRIPVAPTFITQVGSSFASTLAPAGLGGMALNTRFLQRNGVDSAVAVSSVGLSTVSGFATHAVLLFLFVMWAGSSTFRAIHLPDPTVLLWGLLAVLVFAAVMLALPATRSALRNRLLPQLRSAGSGLVRTFKRPTKVITLFGGDVVISLSYITALFLSTLAFGGDISYPKVGAIFLVGAAIATVAPTPGGLGALEAALISGLVAAGMDNAVAVPAVFLYRLATFWIPIAPGWFAFRWLQKADYV
jgi:uncharacterized protein (TIRG00374 family)